MNYKWLQIDWLQIWLQVDDWLQMTIDTSSWNGWLSLINTGLSYMDLP